jgi:hypothetical protein
MKPEAVKQPRMPKVRESTKRSAPGLAAKEPVPSQPVSPCDDLHIRIAQRAYELHAERGYREGYALDDWLEAEREILGSECNA